MQLARIGQPIAVQIAPDPKVGKPCVAAVDYSVAVAVEFGELGHAAQREARLVEVGWVGAEQFGSIVDPAIAVAIERQEAIVCADPAGHLAESVTGKIEVRLR